MTSTTQPAFSSYITIPGAPTPEKQTTYTTTSRPLAPNHAEIVNLLPIRGRECNIARRAVTLRAPPTPKCLALCQDPTRWNVEHDISTGLFVGFRKFTHDTDDAYARLVDVRVERVRTDENHLRVVRSLGCVDELETKASALAFVHGKPKGRSQAWSPSFG